MTYIVSLILGALIALTALIAQVFFGIFAEVLLHTSWQPHYDTTVPLTHALPWLVATAFIEEGLRTAVFAKQFFAIPLSRGAAITHGIGAGMGFWLCELALRTMDATAVTTLASGVPPLLIHITASVLIFACITQWRTAPLFLRIGGAFVSALLVHLAGNSLIFLLS